MKKTIISVIVSLLVLMAFGLSGQAKEYRIGVTQIVEHPALDAAVDGFQAALEDAGVAVKYDKQNAQGDMSTAMMIAQKFANANLDLILAVATPTAQAAANATSRIPILITAVTDPQAAGLVKSNELSGTNVAGTSDMNPVGAQLALLSEVNKKIKKVGVLYNAGETNSTIQVDMAKKEAKALGYQIIEAPVSNSSEVYQAAMSLVGRVDAIYVPTDNTVVSAFESVAKVAAENDLPVVAGEENTVARGAYATVGVDYYRLGYQTGEIAVEILAGRAKPEDMAIQYQENFRLVVNPKAAREQGFSLSQSFLDRADVVVE